MAVSHKSVPGAGFSSAQEDDDGGKGDGGEGAQSWGSSVQESDPRSLVLSVWCLMTPEVLLSTPLHYNGDILLFLLLFSWNVWFYCGKYTQHKIYHSNHSYHISSELLHLPQLKLCIHLTLTPISSSCQPLETTILLPLSVNLGTLKKLI